MSTIFDQEYKEIPLSLYLDVVEATRKHVAWMREKLGYEPIPDPVPDPAKEVTVRFEAFDKEDGTFALTVWLEGLEEVDHFTSVEIQPRFFPQVEFLGVRKGPIIDKFGYIQNVVKDSPKYGKFVAYTHEGNKVDGREDGVIDPEMLVIFFFRGPIAAAEFITFSQFSIAHNLTQLPIAANPRITG